MRVLTLSRNRFLQAGLIFLGLIAAILLALAALVTYCLHTPLVLLWIFGILSGPIPPLLTHLDITNARFLVLWLLIIPPYWFILGASAGLIGWKHCSSRLQQEGCDKQGLRITFAAAVILLFALGWPSLRLHPGFVYGGSSPENTIKNNLRIIEGCKDQLAIEKKLSLGHILVEADLAPYLKGGTIRHVGSERYILNSIGIPCYAVLDADWRIRRKGWEEGRTIPKGNEFRQ